MFRRLGIAASRARDSTELSDASKIILPGVGAFDHAMRLLEASGMRAALEELVLEKRIPVLGVCVGMQIMAAGSDEGVGPGLGWVPARVRALAESTVTSGLPLPHMGWNDINVCRDIPLLRNFEGAPRFYFLHSYYFDCEDSAHVAATATYGFDFACIIAAGNILGVQCHPEKSHKFGARLLRNFAEL